MALLAFVLLWLREFRRARSLEGMLRAWGWVLFWYVLVASGWFWPWYVTWAVAIVALLPWTALTTATLLLAGGSLTLYSFLPLHSAGIYGYRSVVAFGPALGYLLWLGWSRYRHREARIQENKVLMAPSLTVRRNQKDLQANLRNCLEEVLTLIGACGIIVFAPREMA